LNKGDDHVIHMDIVADDKDQGQDMSDIQDSIAVGRDRRNLCKPSWLNTNMIMAYNLSVIEEAILSTYREAEITSES